jgi:hypothetical protein
MARKKKAQDLEQRLDDALKAADAVPSKPVEDPAQQKLMELACGPLASRGIALGEARQALSALDADAGKALKALQERGLLVQTGLYWVAARDADGRVAYLTGKPPLDKVPAPVTPTAPPPPPPWRSRSCPRGPLPPPPPPSPLPPRRRRSRNPSSPSRGKIPRRSPRPPRAYPEKKTP